MKRYTRIPHIDREWDEFQIAEYAAYEKPDMSETDRLGLAYCRLNSWLWDDIVGECPKDFYSLPRYASCEKSRRVYIEQPFKELREKLGAENCSKYWWIYKLGEPEDAWREWYFYEREKQTRRSKVLCNIVRSLWLLLVGATIGLLIMRLIQH